MARKSRKWFLMRGESGRGGLTYADVVLATSPIAYWPLDETSGATAKNYGSLGTAANGAYSGPTLAQVAAPGGGMAPLFDGNDDIVNLYSAALAGAFSGNEGSMAFWFKLYQDTSTGYLLKFFTDSGNEIWVRHDSGTIRYNCDIGADTDIHEEAHNSTDWAHVVITWSVSNGRKRYYLNGVLKSFDAQGAANWAGALAANGCVFGVLLSDNPLTDFSGYASHLTLWTSELDLTTIQNLYNSGL